MLTRTILIVEDEPIQRRHAAEMFEAAGRHVVAFESGDIALDYIRQYRHDIAAIFTDVKLPGDTDGIEIASLVAQVYPGIAVVVTSGRYTGRPPGLRPEIRYLSKPWMLIDVLNAVIDASLAS